MTKAKHKLSDFDFSKKGCHISLVGPDVGGPANGVETLVLKSVAPNGEKMSKVNKAAVSEFVAKAVAEAVEKATKDLAAKLEAAEKEKADMKDDKDKEEKKVKKAKLVAAVGEAQADLLFKSLKGLPSDEFDVVVKGFEAARAAEAKGDMFVEKGVDGKADAKKVEEDATNNATAKYLKSKYSKA